MKTKILLLLVCAAVFTVKAQVTVPKDYNKFFADTAIGTGVLEQTLITLDAWKVSTSTSWNGHTNPAIENSTLSYSNYVDNLKGKAIVLTPVATGATPRASVFQMTYSYTDLTTGYLSFLLNVSEAVSSNRSIVSFDRSNGNTQRGRINVQSSGTGYVLNSTVDGTPVSGISNVLSFGTTYLVVLKHEITTSSTTAGAGTTSLFVNPTPGGSEPSPTTTISDTGVSSLDGIRSIIVNQTIGVGAKIAGLRFSTNWADVVRGGGLISGVSNPQSNIHNIYAANNEIISNVAGQLKVYSLSGVELLSAKTEGKFSTKLNNGLYLVRFTDKSGLTSVAKVQL